MQKNPSDVFLWCWGFYVLSAALAPRHKKSSLHFPSYVTVLTSLWSASVCLGSELAERTDLVKTSFIVISFLIWFTAQLQKWTAREGESKDYDLYCGLSYSCVGKQEGFEHRALCRRKGSCISSGKNQVRWGSSPLAGQADGKSSSEAEQQEQTIVSTVLQQ